LLGVFGALDRQLAGNLIWREDPGAQAAKLEARYEGLTVSAERCAPRKRG